MIGVRSISRLRARRTGRYASLVPNTLVECVPNFSEGRDAAKVDAIVEAMKVPGVYLLDREMDSDHNRCVITLVGDREAIEEAAIRGVGKAAELIDLTKHQGAHPRMGAADVIPFIPIDGVTIEDCVAMAKRVAAEIAKRYAIPTYLYEAAAATPERQNLENIRRGQFEGIRDDIATNRARNRSRRTQGIDRLQRVSEHPECRHREKDRQGGAVFNRRPALRKRRRIFGSGNGAGLDEPDGL